MAKKSKDEEEESYSFKPPKFDEKEFMQQEIKKGRTTHFTILLGIAIGVLSLALTSVNQIGLAVFLGFLVLLSIKSYFNLVRVEYEFFEKKDWVGAGATYLFTWVVVWTLLINPPFSDFSTPDIKTITILGVDDAGNWTLYESENAATLIHAGEDIQINVSVSDNVGVNYVELVFNTSICSNQSGPDRWDHSYLWTLSNLSAGEHFISVISEDDNGHTSSRDGIFTVNPDDSNPQILDVQLLGLDAAQEWVEFDESNSESLINAGEDVRVNATVSDNIGIRNVQLVISSNAVASVLLTGNETGTYTWLLETVNAG